MLKCPSKLFLDISLSVLATVIGSYLAQNYITGRSTAKAPVSLADATVDQKRAGANAAPANAVPAEAVHAEVMASEGSSDVVGAIGPVAAVSARIVDPTNDEKVVPTPNKLAKPTSVPAQHRRAQRDKRISRTNTTATREIASKSVAPPEPIRPTTERFFTTGANSSIDAPPLDPEMEHSHLARRVLKPIIRTALLLLEPSSLFGREHEPQRRTSEDEILSASRVVRPERTERSLSERR